MAGNYLEEFIRNLDQWGITDIFLPFLLIFVVVYAILQKTNILGEDKKKLNVMMGVIIGLLVVIPHVMNTYPKGWDIVEIINEAIPSVSFVLIAVIMLLILLGIFGSDATAFGKRLGGWITILATAIILIIFGAAAGWWTSWDWFEDTFGQDVISLVVILLIFGIIISFITGGEKDESKPKRDIGRGMADVFEKK